jgi:acetoin utilization deacetylase AcuC-like enzyme
MLIYWNASFANHQTGRHPESPARIQRLNASLKEAGYLDKAVADWKPCSNEDLQLVHAPSYLEQLAQWCREGAGRIEADTVVSLQSWEVATLAAGAVVDAVSRVMSGDDPMAFCAIRPPGHHALPKGAMGFCLLNNVAIAARKALNLGAHRVLIVDWDVHHGNGTQDTFWTDSKVAFYSMHRFPFYPGSGREGETGEGEGLGWTMNLPVAYGTRPADFLSKMKDQVELFATKVKPDLILISAGFDAHRQDPVGDLGLDEEHYRELGQWVAQLGSQHSKNRVVSLLEGGYNLDHMPSSVLAYLNGLERKGSTGRTGGTR